MPIPPPKGAAEVASCHDVVLNIIAACLLRKFLRFFILGGDEITSWPTGTDLDSKVEFGSSRLAKTLDERRPSPSLREQCFGVWARPLLMVEPEPGAGADEMVCGAGVALRV